MCTLQESAPEQNYFGAIKKKKESPPTGRICSNEIIYTSIILFYVFEMKILYFITKSSKDASRLTLCHITRSDNNTLALINEGPRKSF